MAKNTKNIPTEDLVKKDAAPVNKPGETKEAADPAPAVVPNSNPASGSALPTGTQIMYPDDFTYDEYKSSGYVDKATENPFTYDEFSYGKYQESETVQQANAALQSILAAQPGAYQSQWQGQIDSIINRILNREKFTYDVNSDALYQQYAEQYQRLGKIAMQDTMGQAAAMTGGYGNSYASTVGNQAYQNYLSQLNDKIPELYKLALDKYQLEGQEMYNQYGLLSDQEQQDYGRYRDQYADWLAERDYATGRYDSERDYDYGKYVDDRNFEYGKYSDDKSYAYNDYVNAIELAKWKETDEYNRYINDRNQKWNEHLTKIDQAETQAEFLEDQRRYNTSRQDDLNSEAKAYAREDVMTVLSAGGDVTDEELAAAGMSRKVADAVKVISSATNSSSSVAEEAALKHVGTMSSKDIIDTLEFYAADGNNTAIEALLDDAFMTERIDEATYLDWKKKYLRTNSHTITDTTVATPTIPIKGFGGGGQAVIKN